jgi:hypothetical protein
VLNHYDLHMSRVIPLCYFKPIVDADHPKTVAVDLGWEWRIQALRKETLHITRTASRSAATPPQECCFDIDSHIHRRESG